MNPTRRDLAALAAAAAMIPAAARADGRLPLVIAHRGASGERPEETRLAYDLAIDEGADFIEPDLVATQDGILVARHENEISATTDVAGRPEFAARKATKTIDGQKVTGWFTEDFTLAELKTLTCRERLPQLRPQSAKFDGQGQILTFQEVIDIARAGSVRTARVIGVIPEMKHPSYFASIGLGLEERLADAIRTNGYNSPAAAMFVQCFEVGALKTFGRFSRARRVMLVDAEGGPPDQPDVKFADMVTPAGLKAMRAYADVVAPNQSMVLDFTAPKTPAPTPLVADAHSAGLMVHSWAARPENEFLPKALQKGDPKRSDFARRQGDFHALLVALYAARVDGVFTDVPKEAVRAREDAMRLLEKLDRQKR
ncbi:MAG TPA: glycerophosphodiester phosphodiesterase family protein [Caulobacteraceae bacterium]|nr:glycerophosphodiester phosphodiesterase family protein [Caulobacteraceae bacterium]